MAIDESEAPLAHAASPAKSQKADSWHDWIAIAVMLVFQGAGRLALDRKMGLT